jgi:hypothetical protein
VSGAEIAVVGRGDAVVKRNLYYMVVLTLLLLGAVAGYANQAN